MTLERTTVHINDDTGRVAMYDKRTSGTDSYASSTVRYQYSNHLSTASLELDGSAAIISYEEYHPYGTSSFKSSNTSINAVAKRYKYTGKERDEETGLYYHGARYYCPWLARWCAVDPMDGKFAPESPYNYGHCNPIVWQDSTGMAPDRKDKETPQPTTGQREQHNENGYTGKPVEEPVQLPEHTVSAPAKGGNGINYTMSGHATLTTSEGGNPTPAPSHMQPQPPAHQPNFWDAYKFMHPVQAGVVSGTAEFVGGTLQGAGNLLLNPDGIPNALRGLGDLMAASNMFSTHGMEVRMNIAGRVNNTINEFKTGDAYTKTKTITGGALFVASFAVGAGEVKTTSSVGKIGEVVTAEIETISLITANRTAGNAFREDLASLLRLEGREVRTEVYKWTPFGKRYMDLDVWMDGINLGGIETKVGSSNYTTLQQLKDLYLEKVTNYPVNLVRKPSNW